MVGTRRLLLPAQSRAAIETNALRRRPEEACGVLLGSSGPDETTVERVLTEQNVHPGERHRRYRIAPERLLAAQKRARREGLEVVGYYHSHPDSPARPSSTDQQDAWSHLSYVIVAVTDGGLGELRSWRLDPESELFVEETVVTS